MANSTDSVIISDLDTIESVSDTDVMLIENSTDTYKVPISKLAESMGGSGMSSENPTGTGSLSINRKADTDIGTMSTALGNNATASGSSSLAEGFSTVASGSSSHAEGENTTASGTDSHTEGRGTTASGQSSHAEGQGTTASGEYSHSEGYNTTAYGECSHSEGSESIAGTSGAIGVVAAHAEGQGCTATGLRSHAEGFYTTASGNGSHSEGSYTSATADSAHAEGAGTSGSKNIAAGASSHVEGYINQANGASSHAEGTLNVANANYSHVEGSHNEISSGGYNSHVEGEYNTANYPSSHVEGHHNSTSAYGQSVCGRFNSNDSDALFIVGNGAGDGQRSNAFKVNSDGTATVGTAPANDMDVATKKYVDDHSITVDSSLNNSSANPVQNRVINGALSSFSSALSSLSQAINTKANTSDIPTYSADDPTGTPTISMTAAYGSVEAKTAFTYGKLCTISGIINVTAQIPPSQVIIWTTHIPKTAVYGVLTSSSGVGVPVAISSDGTQGVIKQYIQQNDLPTGKYVFNFTFPVD